jgi:hypothetical protein
VITARIVCSVMICASKGAPRAKDIEGIIAAGQFRLLFEVAV